MSLAAATIERWRGDPVAFVRENFQVEPDAWQVEALRLFANRSVPLLSLQACAGPGKSAVLAWCGWHFLSCWGEVGDHPKGLAVAITSDNLRANLWPEFSKWQQRSPFLSHCFTWTSERIFENGHKATWFLEARSWPKTANAEEQGKTISGLHGNYVLVLVDESGAIPGAVARAAEQALSTGPYFGKVVQAGNPLTRDGMLYEAAESGNWRVVRITGDPDDPMRSPRIDIAWARSQIAKYGRENAWVKAYILGEFPASGLRQLLGPDEVREAMKRHKREDEYRHSAKVLGVDVAREGDDASVIFPRQGVAAFRPVVSRDTDSLLGAGLVANKWREFGAHACFIDNTGGFGGGWIDQLRVMGRQPIGVHFAGKANDERYANKRAEMWFLMAQWIKEGGALPDIPEMVQELTAPTYTFKGDRLLLEDKDQIKERIGRSPDYADALALTFAQPVHSPELLPSWAAPTNVIPDYNPYARKR